MIISGMHLSLANHFCKGEMVAAKWSFSGKIADCGMNNSPWRCPLHNGISSDCCHDEITYLTIDNYVLPTTQFNDLAQAFVPVFIEPNAETLSQRYSKIFLVEDIKPPNNINISAVQLAYICVFRI